MQEAERAFAAQQMIANGTIKDRAMSMTGASAGVMKYMASLNITSVSEMTFAQRVRASTIALKEQALAWAATPMGMATIAITGISLLVSGISWVNQKLEENKQKLKEVAQEASKQADESAKAVSTLSDLKTQLTSGTKSSNELTSAFKEQLKAMGYTEGQIDALINKYGGLSGAIDEATRKALENARTDAHTDVATSSKSLETTYDPYGMSGDTKSTVRLGEYDSIGNELRNKILEIMKPVAIDMDSLMGTITMGANSDSAEDIYAYYQGLQQVVQLIQETASKTNNEELLNSSVYKEASETLKELGESAKLYGDAINRLHSADAKIELADYLKANDINSKEAFDSYIKRIQNSTEYSDAYKQVLIDVANDAFPQFSNSAKDTGENVNKMTVSLSEMKSASENISALQKGFKELSDVGYITTSTLAEIQEATKLSGDEWDKYQTKLMSVKVGSADYNQVMAELTHKILDNTFAGKDLNDVTEDQIEAVLRENGVVNASAVAHDWLTKKKQEEKAATVAAQIAEGNFEGTLEEVASQCGLTASALATMILKMINLNETKLNLSQQIAEIMKLRAAMDLSTTKLTSEEIYGMGVIPKQGTSGKYGYSYKGKWYNTYNELYKDVLYDKTMGDFGGEEEVVYTPPVYTDDKSGSNGRDKDADPLKADIDRYALLQNAVDEAEQSLKRLESTEEGLHGSDKLKNIEQQAEAYERIAQAYNDMAWENKQERNDIRWRMEQQGFVFSGDFDSTNLSTNYSSHLQAMYDKYEADKDSRAKFLETIKDMEDGYKRILALNKEVYDNENKSIDALKGHNKEIQNQRQYWEDYVDDQIADIEHRLEVGDALGTLSLDDKLTAYQQMKDIAHQRANDWRALGYDDNSEEVQKWQKAWLDADSSIWDKRREEFDKRLELSEDYIQHSKDFEWENGDNEIEARKRVLDWIQSDYYKSLIKDDKEYYKILEENRLKYREAVKEEFDKANDFANEFLDSQKTILQAQYDVENSVAEARHEINKELETSMTMYGYLEEETRQLLFNQEDYNKLSKELNNIEDEALRLQSEYEDKLHNSTLETVESITSEYQMQYETLMKSYEIAKADLEIAKKKQKLNNVLSERNVRMFINGSWQWVANTEDVINAKAELADAEYAKRVEEAGLTQQESINELTKKQDKLGVVIKQFENGIIDLEDAVSRATKAIGSMPSALSSSYSTVQSSSSSSSSYGGGSGGSSAPSGNTWATIPGLGKVSVHVDSNGNTTNRGLSAGTVVHTNGGDYKIVSAGTKGATYNPSSGYWSVKVKEKNADGTRYTSGGMTLMGEEGFEAYISANGRLIPINQPTIGNIPGGGVVFNTDQMQNLRTLWDMSNLNLNTDRSYINKQSQQVSQTTDNRIIINGMTVDSGSADGQALISALRRYVGNH